MMENTLIALGLFFKNIGIDFSNDNTFINQKSVYIGQLSGVDLGYRFGWYLNGPYCPQLSDDCYRYHSLTEDERTLLLQKQLNQKIETKIEAIKQIFIVPDNMSHRQWVDVLSSWHFLQKISKKSPSESEIIIQKQNPDIANYIKQADNALKTYYLL